jgi:hypothetical protein
VISEGDNVIFTVENMNKQRSLLLLSTSLGDYGVKNQLPFRFDVGDKFNFYCPVCHASLECEHHENLIKVEMEDESGHKYEVCFSRIAGEESTYKLYGKALTSYGSDAGKYEKLFKKMDI